jgi:hypothetical protein
VAALAGLDAVRIDLALAFELTRNGMKQLFLLSCIIFSQQLSAQLPEDALRLSWTTAGGTAREQAIGGAMGSLGGEISALFVNPAGMGFYKKGELVVSPGFHFSTTNSNYLGNSSSGGNSTNFNLGVSGLIFCIPNRSGNSSVFSIAVNRTANFNSAVEYKGQNNYSSYAEQFAEEFSNSGLSIEDALNSTQLSYGTRMALYTYLIDTATINGVNQVISQPLKAGMLSQLNKFSTTGGITEIALGLSGNIHNKWYIGGSIGIPIANYTRKTSYTETDLSGNTNNDFGFFTYQETYNSKAVGINAKLGVIFKPFDFWRFGIAVHTPSLYGVFDHLSASMLTNTENYTTAPGHQIGITSDSLDQATGTSPGQTNYDLVTPWKFIVSGSYVFREIADPSQQKGFVTADAEYSTTNSARFQAPDNTTDNDYFSEVNSVIKTYYKGTFGFRLGAELKFNIIAARAGFAYYTNPYFESDLKAHRMLLSAGAGYRNKGIFIDLTYVESFNRDVNFPYRLGDKTNLYAKLKENTGTLILTVGFKFP